MTRIKLPTTSKDLRGGHFQRIRTFELVCNVDGRLEGELDDWPANIQDKVFAAMEKKANQVKLPLKVVASGCGWDEDHGWYVRVVLSEIVAAYAGPLN